MANEIIKYDSELNTIPLKQFTPVEMNLFFSIISRMRDKKDETVVFSFEQLKELSDYKPTANKRFIDDLRKTYLKLLSLQFGSTSKSGLSFQAFNMFNKFAINGDIEEPYVEIQMNEMAIPLLNNLETWVRYSLAEFRELQSSYSKTMFRLLKQYRTTGWAEFSKANFFELLDIPKSYLNKSENVDLRVLKPIKEELTPLFRGLKISKKYGKGRGKPVVAYRFSWKPEKNDSDDFSKGEREDIRQKLFNIEHNGELSESEKLRAKDRILGLKLGQSEEDKKAQLLAEKQKEKDKQLKENILSDFLSRRNKW